jgi:hypothetical protein
MPSDTKTPPSASSGSPLPLRSLSETSSRRSCSPVFEQGGPSKKTLVVDLSSSSDKEDPIPDTSHNFEFAQRLYGELNRSLLGPPGDGKIIIISDSGEEEEACEETDASAKATLMLLPSTLPQPPPPMTPMLLRG